MSCVVLMPLTILQQLMLATILLLMLSFAILQINKLLGLSSGETERYLLSLQQSSEMTNINSTITVNIMFSSGQYKITIQNNYINFFQKVLKSPVFKFSNLKTNGPHEGNLTILDIKPLTCNNATF